MTDINIIREKVEGYVKEYFKEEKPIFDPIFREENGKIYLGYMVVDFVDEKNNDYRFKRPTKWLIVDLVNGDLVNTFNSDEHDYTDKNKFPFELIFDNYGSSALFNASNYVLTSYTDWKKQVVKDMQSRFTKLSFDPKVLKLGDEIISPNDFVLANVESLLEDINVEIMEKLGSKVEELYKDYYEHIIDSVRTSYLVNGNIDKTLLTNYINLIKYLWPDFIDIINAFNNIESLNDTTFENALRETIKAKNMI